MKENHPALVAGISEAVSEDGAVIIGWVLAAAYKTPEQIDTCGYFYDFMDGQPFHSTVGLVEMIKSRLIDNSSSDE